MRYGITEFTRTACTVPIAVWSGSFYNVFEADGTARDGARSITLHTYNGDKVRATLPDGVTFPRTPENYSAIDEALTGALEAFYA